jgi:hypothetical protein
VQFIGALDVEDADVRVLANDPPQMAPSAIALQLLRARFLVRAQLVDVLGIGVVRNVNLHSDVEKHG